MGVLIVSKKTIGCDYNFATGGGAIGTVSLGIFIPANAIINRFCVKTIVTCNSLGAATLGFNQGIGGLNLFVPLGFAGFIAGQALNGVDFNANPQNVAATFQVVATIAAAALTAGRVVCELEFAEYDL